MLNIKSATLELTGACNLRCTHCFADSGPNAAREEMTLATVRTVIDELTAGNACANPEIWLSGGEPLLHTRFPEIVERIASRGCPVVVATNGDMDGVRLARLLAAKGRIRRLNVSLEGIGLTNDAIRGHGVFARVTRDVIPHLKSEGFYVCVTVHLRKANQFQISEMIDLFVNVLDCDVKFGMLRPVGRARNSLQAEMLSPAEVLRCIRELYRRKGDSPRKRVWHDWDILSGDVKFYVQDYRGQRACPAGTRSIVTITPNGDVLPCAQLRSAGFVLGRAGGVGAVGQALNSDRANALYVRLQQKSSTCRACRFHGVTCQGGCPAVAYGLRGLEDAFAEIDPYCCAHLLTE